MTDMRELFERQAAWQAGRRRLSWPEKIRLAEALRESLAGLRNAPRSDLKTANAERPKTLAATPTES